MSQERATELMKLFDSGWDVYLRDEIDEALTLREEITDVFGVHHDHPNHNRL